MTANDVRWQWLDAIRRKHSAREASLFERAPWNPAVRLLSCQTDGEHASGSSVVRIDSTAPRTTSGRLEVSLVGAAEQTVESFETTDGLFRWNDDARGPSPLLVSSLLHDLKNALGAQSLLLGTAERELRAAADGARALRFEPMLESIGLCRESVAIAADRAQVAQWISSASTTQTMSGEVWLRLALAGISSDEREKLTRNVSTESRTGPRGDVRSLVSAATSLCALASAGDRTANRAAQSHAQVRCENDELVLELTLPSKAVALDTLWQAASGAQSTGGSRSESLIGLAELLSSHERFEFDADAARGTTVRIRAPRSSGVLR